MLGKNINTDIQNTGRLLTSNKIPNLGAIDYVSVTLENEFVLEVPEKTCSNINPCILALCMGSDSFVKLFFRIHICV